MVRSQRVYRTFCGRPCNKIVALLFNRLPIIHFHPAVKSDNHGAIGAHDCLLAPYKHSYLLTCCSESHAVGSLKYNNERRIQYKLRFIG